MFLLDTNVISELLRPRPAPLVVEWLAQQPARHQYLSVLTLGELSRGVALLPDGRRRSALLEWVSEAIPRAYAGRLLPVDAEVSARWGVLDAEARRSGRPLGTVDGLLVATASVHGLALVTRNVSDVSDRGVPVLNPGA